MAIGSTAHDVRLDDGRVLEVLVAGPASGTPLVFNTGTPGGAALFPPLAEAARARGMRVVHYSRPGFGGSTRRPGRSIADSAGDVAAILEAVGADRFVTVGFSGGGPHALASAALLPGRCAAVASVAGLAPYGAPGLDWFAGMSEENRGWFARAAEGGDALVRFLEDAAPKMIAAMQPQPLDAAEQQDPAAADISAFRLFLAESLRQALVQGIDGWRDDMIASVRPWRFDPRQIRCPVAIWHGEKDQSAPAGHGHWLADNVPDPRSHFDPQRGHGIVLRVHCRAIVDELADLAAVSDRITRKFAPS